MAQKFWVNNYLIDVTRNQIQHQQQATQLPPKALKVLEVLAARAGEVVSHDELMELVWQQSVVGPNTLQRAIAQLRKAFGDDSKQQAFIKTHAKQGYSLEASVRWESKTAATNPAELNQIPAVADAVSPTADPNSVEAPNVSGNYWNAAVAVLFLAIAVWFVIPKGDEFYDHITPITASDDQEFNASYSPDGRYLVFNRFVGQCSSQLWAKDLANNQEVQLQSEPGRYSSLSWSADGSQLAYILQSRCDDVVEQNRQCWQLQTLDFAQAWNGQVNSLTRYDCEQTPTTHPKWLNDGRIALLQYPDMISSRPELVIYDSRTERAIQAVSNTAGSIYALDYSRAKNMLASTMVTNQNKHLLSLYSADGDLMSEVEIKRLPHHPVYSNYPISFAPNGEYFLTEMKGQLYRLDTDGELSPIHSNHLNGLSNPVFHPKEHKIAATQGGKDYDVGVLSITDGSADFEVFSRSTSLDINSQFQPNGHLIAFNSYRSGNSQLWIMDGDRTYQLTHFEQGMQGVLFSWAPDGKSLVTNVNNKVALVNLDGSFRLLDTPFAVNVLMPWTQADRVLATAFHTKKDQLFSIDVNTGETTDLALSDVLWAVYTDDSRLIYSDNQKNFWAHTNQESMPINAISGVLSGKRALFKHGRIYGVSAQDTLWQYDLNTNQLNSLAQLDKNIIYVSDIKSGQMLASKFVGGRRELVELSQNK